MNTPHEKSVARRILHIVVVAVTAVAGMYVLIYISVIFIVLVDNIYHGTRDPLDPLHSILFPFAIGNIENIIFEIFSLYLIALESSIFIKWRRAKKRTEIAEKEKINFITESKLKETPEFWKKRTLLRKMSTTLNLSDPDTKKWYKWFMRKNHEYDSNKIQYDAFVQILESYEAYIIKKMEEKETTLKLPIAQTGPEEINIIENPKIPLSEDESLLKICLIGNSKSKTALIRMFAEGNFETDYLPIIGMDITTKKIHFDDKTVKLILADIPGQEFFGLGIFLRPTYYRGASAAIIVFDKNDLKTYETVPDWLAEFRKHSLDPTIPIALVGLISDSEQVTTEEGQKIAKKHNVFYYETQVTDSEQVCHIFIELTRQVLNRVNKS